jgi:hypothetical protein
MRRRIVAWLLSGILILGLVAPLGAQDKKDGPPTPTPQQPPPPGTAPPAPPKYERESPFVPYTLAAVGIVIIMILVCMPVRRD